MATPEPRPSSLICSVCGQAWDKHLKGRARPTKAKPVTTEDCVRVLRAELATRPRLGQVFYGQSGIASSASVPLHGNQFGSIS